MYQKPTVAVVVLNWNNYEDTKVCLEELLQLSYPRLSIYVVDNGSTDDSLERLENDFERPVFIRLASNRGFAGGNNIAISRALEDGADYLWLLNNDTVLGDLSLEREISILTSNPSIGVLSPTIDYHQGQRGTWFERGVINWSICAGQHADYDGNSSIHTENDYIPFCSSFFRSEIFTDVGLLPEKYFLYLEDVDFSVRLENAGYELATDMESQIFHKVSASAGSAYDPISSYYMARNTRLLSHTFPERLSASFSLTYSWWFVTRLLYRLYLGKTAGARAWIEGLVDAFRGRCGKGRYP